MNKKIFFLCIFLTSCGVYKFTGISINPETKTVMVDYFLNKASIVNPTLGQNLTNDLQDKFQRETNLDIVNDKNIADIIFEGFISKYEIAPSGLSSEQDRAILTRLTIEVKVKFIDKLNEKNNYNSSFVRFYDFSSSLNFSDIENTAVDEIKKQIVQDVFDKSFSNW